MAELLNHLNKNNFLTEQAHDTILVNLISIDMNVNCLCCDKWFVPLCINK